MEYTIKAHPTLYKGVMYRSRLEARWAVFFDLAGWKHEYEPIDLPGWSPDFRLQFESDFNAHMGVMKYDLLAEVKPYYKSSDFKNHKCMDYVTLKTGGVCCLGNSPSSSVFVFHCGFEWDGPINIAVAVNNFDTEPLWKEAGNRTQWRPNR